MSARQEAVDALVECLAGEEWRRVDAEVVAELLLRIVSPPLYARLAIESGGMEQVEGYHDVICPLFIWEHDPDLFDEQPGPCGCSPVFRMTGADS
jgi:hypothetical protein